MSLYAGETIAHFGTVTVIKMMFDDRKRTNDGHIKDMLATANVANSKKDICLSR